MHEPFTLRLNRIRKNLFFARTTAVKLLLVCLLVGLSPIQVASAGNVDIYLSDSTNQAPLRNAKIVAYEVSSGGALIWRGKGNTNGSGRLTLNLAGLGTGQKFILKTNPFGTGWSQSFSFTKTGSFDYRVGSVHAKLIQGSNGKTLTNHKAVLYELINGSRKVRGAGNTDSTGIIRFSPVGIYGGNRSFEISAISLYDNKPKSSSKISNPGRYNVLVGNKLLKVRLVNRHNGQVVKNQQIIVYRQLNNGALKSVRAKSTNSNGLTDFDLPGLGAGTTYILRSNPYGVGWTNSADITSTGSYNFKVGSLQFTVLKGEDGSVLGNFPVALYEQNSSTQQKKESVR